MTITATALSAPERPTAAPPSSGTELGWCVVLASAGAGVVHLSAATEHGEHAFVLSFFLVVGALQLAWAAAVARRGGDGLLAWGALGHLGVIGVWVASRTTGLGFVPGAEHTEPIGPKDAIATVLQVVAIAAVVVCLTVARRHPRGPRAGPRTLGPLAAATAMIVVAGVVLPSHDGPTHQHGPAVASHAGPAVAATTHSGDGAPVVTEERPVHAAVPEHTDHAPARVGGAEPVLAEPTEPAVALDEQHASVRYGPFFLPPAALGGEAGLNRLLTDVAKPCTDCYITSATPDLVHEDGSPANLADGAMLHHAVWTRPSIRDTTCDRGSAIGSQGMRFLASGNERTPKRLPPGFGYHVGSDAWNLIVEVMNHGEQPMSVYVSLDVSYVPAPAELHDLTPVWLDVDNCGNSEYAIPAGQSHQVFTWRSTLTGRVVGAGGHVHDGGVKTVLTNQTTDETMCTSVAGYGTDPAYAGSIESMSTCFWDRIGTVRAGEELALHAHYHSSVAQDDAMGIMVAYVYETDDLDGGTPYRVQPPEEQQPPPVHEH